MGIPTMLELIRIFINLNLNSRTLNLKKKAKISQVFGVYAR